MGKKTVLLTSGNFNDQLEFNESGKCKWHEEEVESVKRSLKSMEYFCDCLGLEVAKSIYVLHDNWKEKRKELIEFGNKLKADHKK